MGVWRTVGGRRIYIKEGQDLETAMHESGKFSNIIKKNKHKPIKMSKREYAVFMHEVNTYYGKDETRKTLYKCVGDNLYVFDNYGFNNYNVFRRLKIEGNEEINNAIMRRIDSGRKK